MASRMAEYISIRRHQQLHKDLISIVVERYFLDVFEWVYAGSASVTSTRMLGFVMYLKVKFKLGTFWLITTDLKKHCALLHTGGILCFILS